MGEQYVSTHVHSVSVAVSKELLLPRQKTPEAELRRFETNNDNKALWRSLDLCSFLNKHVCCFVLGLDKTRSSNSSVVSQGAQNKCKRAAVILLEISV